MHSVCYTDKTNYDFKIAVDFEDNTIPKEAEKRFKEFGIDVWEGFDLQHFDIENDEVCIDGPEHFLELFMQLVQITLPDATYEIVNEIPLLDLSMGYGLY